MSDGYICACARIQGMYNNCVRIMSSSPPCSHPLPRMIGRIPTRIRPIYDHDRDLESDRGPT